MSLGIGRSRRVFVKNFENKIKEDILQLVHHYLNELKMSDFKKYLDIHKSDLFRKICVTPVEEFQMLDFKNKVVKILNDRFLQIKSNFKYLSHAEILPVILNYVEHVKGNTWVTKNLRKLEHFEKYLQLDQEAKIKKQSLIDLFGKKHRPFLTSLTSKPLTHISFEKKTAWTSIWPKCL